MTSTSSSTSSPDPNATTTSSCVAPSSTSSRATTRTRVSRKANGPPARSSSPATRSSTGSTARRRAPPSRAPRRVRSRSAPSTASSRSRTSAPRSNTMPTSRREALQQVGGALALSMAPGLASGRADAPRIKIGQIGVGHAHASKLSVYRKSPDYEVVGIVEPDAALRKRVEKRDPYRGLPWLSQDKLLATPGLQAVLVETRVEDLLKTAEACIAAGKHVHLDKPAGTSLPHYKRILKAAEKKKLLVQMGY